MATVNPPLMESSSSGNNHDSSATAIHHASSSLAAPNSLEQVAHHHLTQYLMLQLLQQTPYTHLSRRCMDLLCDLFIQHLQSSAKRLQSLAEHAGRQFITAPSDLNGFHDDFLQGNSHWIREWIAQSHARSSKRPLNIASAMNSSTATISHLVRRRPHSLTHRKSTTTLSTTAATSNSDDAPSFKPVTVNALMSWFPQTPLELIDIPPPVADSLNHDDTQLKQLQDLSVQQVSHSAQIPVVTSRHIQNVFYTVQEAKPDTVAPPLPQTHKKKKTDHTADSSISPPTATISTLLSGVARQPLHPQIIIPTDLLTTQPPSLTASTIPGHFPTDPAWSLFTSAPQFSTVIAQDLDRMYGRSRGREAPGFLDAFPAVPMDDVAQQIVQQEAKKRKKRKNKGGDGANNDGAEDGAGGRRGDGGNHGHGDDDDDGDEEDDDEGHDEDGEDEDEEDNEEEAMGVRAHHPSSSLNASSSSVNTLQSNTEVSESVVDKADDDEMSVDVETPLPLEEHGDDDDTK